MRFRSGEGRGAGHQQEHDARGRHAVLQVSTYTIGSMLVFRIYASLQSLVTG